MTDIVVRYVVDIAADVIREYRQAQEWYEDTERSAHNAMQHAIACGHYLVELKDALPHGEWLPWLEDNFPGAETTARNYMRLHANRQRVADLPVGQALRKLAAASTATADVKETRALLKEIGAGDIIDSTAEEEADDPVLLDIEDHYMTVVSLLANARQLSGLSASDLRNDALEIATAATRALKAYQERA